MEAASLPNEPDEGQEGGAEVEQISAGLSVQGTAGQLSLEVGGDTPTESVLTLTGGQIKVVGQFKKGETVEFSGKAVVREVGARDFEDSKTGQVVRTARKHSARIVELEVSAAGE